MRQTSAEKDTQTHDDPRNQRYRQIRRRCGQDHDHAIALDPANAEAYFSRGQTYYDRAALETVVDGAAVGTDAARKAWFDPAVADFKQAVARDGRHHLAWDMLGLIMLLRFAGFQKVDGAGGGALPFIKRVTRQKTGLAK